MARLDIINTSIAGERRAYGIVTPGAEMGTSGAYFTGFTRSTGKSGRRAVINKAMLAAARLGWRITHVEG